MPNRNNLLRTPYGRYRAGVLIKPDDYGGLVAESPRALRSQPRG